MANRIGGQASWKIYSIKIRKLIVELGDSSKIKKLVNEALARRKPLSRIIDECLEEGLKKA